VRDFHQDTVKLLLANKADVNTRDNLGRTPLYEAVMVGDKGMVHLLLANKADVNVRDDKDRTLLAIALRNGHRKVAELLRKQGAQE
jgi:ankyrin repeat protein